MVVVVSVAKHGNENSMALIRRFSKRVQGAGIVRVVKGNRFRARPVSKNRRKASALVRLEKREKREVAERLGLIQPRERSRARR